MGQAATRRSAQTRPVHGLRVLFARRDDPYAGADLDNAKRLGALLLAMDAIVSLALFPVSPPDERIGSAGWVVGLVAVAILLIGASRLIRSERVSFNVLLVTSYVMIVQIALLEWLAGGHDSPYNNLFLLPLVFAAGIHPPRRLLPLLLAVGVALYLPLAYDGWDSSVAADTSVQFLLWSALACAMVALMTVVRGQRLNLRAGQDEALRLARVDPLTGLGNRRAFDERLNDEIAHARRDGGSLSVVILDVDDFKQINDGFGHLNGDRCLREVADKVTEAARVGDSGFRWGGDEFAILLPGSNYAGAQHVVERLEQLIAERVRRPDGQTLAITCGIAELTEAANAGDFLAAADLALMSLKTPSKTHQEEAKDQPLAEAGESEASHHPG